MPKISYCVTEKLTYRGTIDISEEEYRNMNKAADNSDDKSLGQLILDCIDRRDPQDWDIDSVDEFEEMDR